MIKRIQAYIDKGASCVSQFTIFDNRYFSSDMNCVNGITNPLLLISRADTLK